MCFAIYIGTTTTQTTGAFVANQTDLYLEEPGKDKEVIGLRPKFKNRHIYYVGSYQGCSCGFAYDPSDPKEQDDDDDKEEEGRALKSVIALVSLIRNLTKFDNVEFYCCWEGDWEEPIEKRLEVDITQIKLGTNYFGLTERQFILFKKQSDN
jgi:hypothetical protein